MTGNISLTQIVFAGLVGTFLIANMFGIYAQFVILNGVTIDEPYNTALQSIANQYSGFEDLANAASDKSLVINILDFGKSVVSGSVNVFVVGLDAVGKFFNMIPIIGSVISSISQAVPGFTPVLGLFTIIIGLYIGMRYIQTVTNKSDLP